MKNLVKHKKGSETMRIGSVRVAMVWDGIRKKPTVTYSTSPHTIPEEGSLDTVISEEDNAEVLKRITLL